MPDILIRGMEMPVEQPVTLILDPSGRVWLPDIKSSKEYMAKELPPHGDLIDQSKIYAEAVELSGPITGDGWDNFGVYDLIKRQPVVVPAERREG